MSATILHDDEHGFHIAHAGRIYKSLIATRFDEGEEVRIASSVPYSDDPLGYIIVRSADGQIAEDWKAS